MPAHQSDTSVYRPYYTPSGHIPISAIPIAILGALATASSAGLYAWLTVHAPLIGDFVVTVFFSVALGFTARYTTRKAKVRNPLWMGRFGILIGLLAWYVQWAAYLAIIAGVSSGYRAEAAFLSLLAHPVGMADMALTLSRTGVFQVFGLSIPSGLLIAAWLLELGIFVLMPYVFAQQAAGDPFCERSNSWMEELKLPYKFDHIDTSDDLVQQLETQPDSLFSVLAPCRNEEQPEYATVTVYRGEAEGDLYISIANIDVETSGQTSKERTTPVVLFLRLAGRQVEELTETLSKLSTRAAPSSESMAQSDPPELTHAIDLLGAEHFDAVIDAASPYVKAERSDLRVDANRLCALATARRGRWPESLAYWKALFDDEPTAHNALQIATSSAMSGNLADAEQWIGKAREINEQTRELPGMQILTNYVSALSQAGQAKTAMSYLEEIREIYQQVGNTDPTYLYMRRLPLFEAFLNNSAPVLRAALGPEQSRHWYLSMLPHLDEHGKVTLNDWLEGQSALTVE